jgi:N-acetylglucosaminyl-diphospho-decaprenol L-rhamnosyltransferase
MSDIGIVIVTYNSAAEIGECLEAALPTKAAIVVVDNASSDGTVEEVARHNVRLIANSTNRGFAAAVNQGFAVLDSPYILLLNPDSVLMTGLDPLRVACDLPRAAGAGGRLVDQQGKLQAGFMVRRLPMPSTLILEALLLNRFWPGNPVNQRYRQFDLNYDRRTEVEQPAGAFLMVRRAVWQELGGFDEGFSPLWFEDVDFCRRLVDQGYRLFYVPEAVAKHRGGHSISQLTLEMRQIYWYRNLIRYSARHFGPFGLRAVCLAIIAGSFLRMIGDFVRQRGLQPMAAYGKVIGLASRCFLFGGVTELALPVSEPRR